jgi:hypothetical protein
MKRLSRTTCRGCALLAVLAATPPMARASDAPATLPAAQPVRDGFDDIRAELAAGNPRAALQTIARRLREPRLAPSQRYALLMLRGDALVRLRQRSGALDAFRSALRSADAADADPPLVLDARAMVELFGSTNGWAYRSASGETFDLIESASRRSAVRAMFEDRLLAARSRVEAAKRAPTLGPMIDLLPELGALLALEHAGTGGTERSVPLLRGLGEHALDLIGRELQRLGERVDELEDLANEPVFFDRYAVPGRRGLHSNERRELVELIAYVERIVQSCEDGRRVNRQTGGTGEAWDDMILAAGRTQSWARSVLATQDVRIGRPPGR